MTAADITDTRQLASTHGGAGSLYVIEIGTDRIKVGWSGNPEARLKSHRAAARAYGTGAGREWSSPAHDLAAETALINFCADQATEQLAREFFIGVPFEDAVSFASTLTIDPPDRPAKNETVLVHVRRGTMLRDLLDVPLSEMVRDGQALVVFVRDGVATDYQPERAS